MIIWGSTGKEKKIDTCEFFCPNCQEEAECSTIRVSRYFTLYFIPLFPMETLGEYIRCNDCRSEYSTAVLDLTREEYESAAAPWACGNCGNKNTSDCKKCLSCQRPRTEVDVFLE